MEIQGTVVKVMEPVRGTSARGEWTKQEVILEQQGEFGRKVCVSFWGDKAQDAASLKEGEQVVASVNVESREFNNRWYTEIRVWKLTRQGAGENPGGYAGLGNAPFAPPAAAPMPTSEPAGAGAADSFDDLPF